MHIHTRAASITFRDSCLLSWSLYVINIFYVIYSYVCVHVRASSYLRLLCACMRVYLNICICGYIYTYGIDDVASNMLVTVHLFLKLYTVFIDPIYSVSLRQFALNRFVHVSLCISSTCRVMYHLSEISLKRRVMG